MIKYQVYMYNYNNLMFVSVVEFVSRSVVCCESFEDFYDAVDAYKDFFDKYCRR